MRFLKILLMILVVSTVGAGVFMSYQLSKMTRCTEVIESIGDLRFDLSNASMAFNDYLITADPETKNEFESSMKKVKDDLERLRSSFPEEVESIVSYLKDFEDTAHEIFSIPNPVGNTRGIELMEKGNAIVERKLIGIFEEMYSKAVESHKRSSEVLAVLPYAFAIFMGGILFYAFLITSRIVRAIDHFKEAVRGYASGDFTYTIDPDVSKSELREVLEIFSDFISGFIVPLLRSVRDGGVKLSDFSEKVSASASETNASVDNFKDNFVEIASTGQNMREHVKESISSIDEILRGTEDVANSATDLSGVASDLNESARSGKSALEGLVRTVKEAVERTSRAREKISKLVDFTTRINEIVEAVTSIAEQTNLLALNAAIEAARAGEAGKGFAVVADEIRKLAEESRKAAGEISEVLKSVNENIEIAREDMERVGESVHNSERSTESVMKVFERLANMASNVSERSENLAAVVQEQTASAQEISNSLEVLETGLNGFFERIDEMRGHAEELSKMGDDLEALAGDLARMAEDFEARVKDLKLPG